MTTENKTVKVKKAKTIKCCGCGRWIGSPVNVGGRPFGSGCAKKARIELAIAKDKAFRQEEAEKYQASLVQEVLPVAPIAAPASVEIAPAATQNNSSDLTLLSDEQLRSKYQATISARNEASSFIGKMTLNKDIDLLKKELNNRNIEYLEDLRLRA